MNKAAKIASKVIYLFCFFVGIATGALAASNSLVINEFMFNPSGSDAGSEWVEFIAKNDVNINGWQFTDQDGHTYTFPNLSLKAGEIVVLHIGTGTNDLTGPVYHLYTGTNEEWFDNDGDDLLLRDQSGNTIDYVAYGSGGNLDPPPADATWANNIDITYVEEGHSLGLGEDGIDHDDGNYFAEYDSPTPGNPNQTPSLSVEKTGADSISRGDSDGEEYTITITNNGDGVAYGIEVEDDYPSDFSVVDIVSVKRNGVDVTYNQSDNGDKITFSNLPNLLKGDTLEIKLRLTPDCSSSIGFKTNISTVRYHGLPDLSDSLQSSQHMFDIEVKKGILKNVMEAIAINGVPITPTPTPEAEVGDVITYRVSLQNTGDGDLFNVSSEFTWGSGLSYQGNLTCSNVSCSYDSVNGKITASTDRIPGHTEDSSYSYTFDLKVEACEGLTGSTNSTEKCAEESTISSGVIVIIKNPDIDYTVSPSPIDVPYGGTQTVTISVTNNGSGKAYEFKLDTNLENLPVTVSNVSPGWSYDSSTGTFAYSGEIAPSSTVSLRFDLQVNSTCDDRSPSGTITFSPDYQNSCGKHFYAPTKYTTFSTSEVPEVEIRKEASSQYVAVGNNVEFTVTLNVSNPSNLTGNITVTDDVPSEIENVSASVTKGTVNVSGNTITWTVSPSEADGAQLTITGNVKNDPCLQGTTATNTATYTVTDSHFNTDMFFISSRYIITSIMILIAFSYCNNIRYMYFIIIIPCFYSKTINIY